ncbi:hypothetical protein ALC60_04079, partial [Trachymyrmex zeteki]
AGVAPLDNAVNTKGTGPSAIHPTPQTRTTNTQGAVRWVAVALAVVVRGWRNTNKGANFELLYACWELAGPERKRERKWSRTDRREEDREDRGGGEKGRNRERKGERKGK